jgi:chromosome segregation ATPase
MESSCCAICLETLSSRAVIGSCVPCGHCFHVECYNTWKTTGRSASKTKCPTCNTESSMFCRLYVDLRDLNFRSRSKSRKSDVEGNESNNDEMNESADTIAAARNGNRNSEVRSKIDYKAEIKQLQDNYSGIERQFQQMKEDTRCKLRRYRVKLQQEVLERESLQRRYDNLQNKYIRLKEERCEMKQTLEKEQNKYRNDRRDWITLREKYDETCSALAESDEKRRSLKAANRVLESKIAVVIKKLMK